MKKYTLSFDREALSEDENGSIGSRWAPLDSKIVSANAAVGTLDRYDDFAIMKIPFSSYKRPDGAEYGIPYNPNHHTDTKILISPAQQKSAKAFMQGLRGFGMLADVVGTGKTYEAGVIISELCARGVTTILIVAPSQLVTYWKDTIEVNFGFGKNMFRIFELDRINGDRPDLNSTMPKYFTKDKSGQDVWHPKYPLIMAMEDFAQLDDSFNALFDLIVVDEVHNIYDMKVSDLAGKDSANENKFVGGMYRLSKLMELKTKTNSNPYCLLLSATPHSGNLKTMFPLWMFIRSKGGDPEYFRDPAQDIYSSTGRGEVYKNEIKLYRNDLCLEADTVAEFIDNAKNYYLINVKLYIDKQHIALDAEFKKFARHLLSTFTVRDGAGSKPFVTVEEFDTLSQEQIITNVNNFKQMFNNLPRSAKIVFVRELLTVNDYSTDEEEEAINRWRTEFNSYVSDRYHNRLMRTIMIRNSRQNAQTDVRLSSKEKTAVNVLFMPTEKRGVLTLKNGVAKVEESEGIKIDLDKIDGLEDDKFISFGSIEYSFDEYYDEFCSVGVKAMRRGELYDSVIKHLYAGGLADGAVKKVDAALAERIPRRDGTTKDVIRNGACNYYIKQISRMDSKVKTLLSPTGGKGILDAKIDYLKKIIRKHSGAQILIFFDYNKRAQAVGGKKRDRMTTADLVLEALKNDSDIMSRIIVADQKNSDLVNKSFEKYSNKDIVLDADKDLHIQDDTVLFVKHRRITEGTNLQTAAVIINFEVTCDPVAMEQRIGRVFRFGQKNDVTVYSLGDMTALEGSVLAYYARIGLFTADAGDATIIAGGSTDNMTAVRCPQCKDVKLISKTEYEAYKKRVTQDNVDVTNPNRPYNELLCQKCRRWETDSKTGKEYQICEVLTEISIMDFECDCGYTFYRNNSSYYCGAFGAKPIVHDTSGSTVAQSNKVYKCSKTCLMLHCKKFNPQTGGEYDCEILRKVRSSGVDELSAPQCEEICRKCNKCEAKCRPYAPMESCIGCDSHSGDCNIVKLNFNNEWAANCPMCTTEIRTRTLRAVAVDSFSKYVGQLWDKSEDPNAFFKKFGADAETANNITEILKMDSDIRG